MKKLIILIICIFQIDQTVLSAQCFEDRHSTNWFDGWVSCSVSASPNPALKSGHWILYDLTALYKISSLRIWNTNDPQHLDWGTSKLHISYSEDSIIWKNVGDVTLEKASGSNTYEGSDWIPLDIPKAKYILLTSKESFGGSCHGIAEVNFQAEKVKINTASKDDLSKSKPLSLVLTPNPFSQLLRLNIQDAIPGDYILNVHNSIGDLVDFRKVSVQSGEESLEVDARSWPAGSYVFTLTNDKIQVRIVGIKMTPQ